jgi:hypothetical protein
MVVRVNKYRKIAIGFFVGTLFTCAPFFGLFGTDVAMGRMFRVYLAAGMNHSWLSTIGNTLVLATGVAIRS